MSIQNEIIGVTDMTMPELRPGGLAIVIGINDYLHVPRLQTAVADAEELATILRNNYQYDVQLFTNAQANYDILTGLLEQIQQQNLCFPDGRAIEENDRILFYFAGHGIAEDDLDSEEKPEGFLIPQDVERDEMGKLFKQLRMRDVHDALVALPCRHLLIILDCCFAGNFRWAGLQRDMVASQKMYRERYDYFTNHKAQQVITSAAYNQTASDSIYRFGKRKDNNNGSDHSPFAQYLFQILDPQPNIQDPFLSTLIEDKVITVSEIHVYLQRIFSHLRLAQTPDIYKLKNHDTGEYIFPLYNFDFQTGYLTPAVELNKKLNPYRGLEAYEKENSDLFFGRQDLRKKLCHFVAQHPLIVVLGASGSGKSSLVKAGLLPDLTNESQWHIFTPIRPGESPISALNLVLTQEKLPMIGLSSGSTDSKANRLAESFRSWCQHHRNTKLLLVIDQAEELITLCQKEEEREEFLKLLKGVLDSEDLLEQIRLVMTLRSDFEPQLRDTVLQPNWEKARFLVTAMTREELRQAIEEPAAAQVMFFESPQLVNQLIEEVANMPGALSLLSFTLSELYIKYIESGRGDRTITQKDYNQLGGVTRSLTQRADHEYEKLVEKNSAYKQAIRNVMLRMVAIGGGELARRRVIKSELKYPQAQGIGKQVVIFALSLLIPKGLHKLALLFLENYQTENERVQKVIQRFQEARLLVGGSDPEDNTYIEPAHDELVRGWSKIKQWLKERQTKVEKVGWERSLMGWLPSQEESPEMEQPLKVNLALQRELTTASNNWRRKQQNEGDRKALGFLWNDDPRLPQLKQVQQSKESWLNALEENFVARSLQRKRNNLLRLISAVSVACLGIYGTAVFGESQATRSSITALIDSSKNALNTNQQLESLIAIVRAGRQLEKMNAGLGGLIQNILDSNRWTEIKFKTTLTLHQVLSQIQEKNRLEGHSDQVNHVVFCPLNSNFEVESLIATASDDLSIKLWKPDGTPIQTLEYNEEVTGINFSPDCQILASSSNNGNIKLWKSQDTESEAVNYQQYKTLTIDDMATDIRDVSISPDGQTIAAVSCCWSKKGQVKLWNMKGELLKTFKGQDDNFSTHKFSRISFSPDSQLIALAGLDNIKLWNKNGQLLGTLDSHRGEVRSIRFSPDGTMLASAGDDKLIKFWDVNNLNDTPIHEWEAHDNTINHINFSPDGTMFASSSDDNILKLWDSKDIESLKSIKSKEDSIEDFKGHQRAVKSHSFSSDGIILASASDDGTVKIWKTNQNHQSCLNKEPKTCIVEIHQGEINPLSVSFSPQTLAIIDEKQNQLCLANVAQTICKPLTIHPEERIVKVSFSSDGKTFATIDKNNDEIKLRNINKDNSSLSLGVHQGVYSINFSPKGNYLLSAGTDNQIKLWNMSNQLTNNSEKQPEKTIEGCGSDKTLSFSLDEKILVFLDCENKKIIKLWSFNEQKEIANLQGHNEPVTSIIFSHDGKTIASASKDRTIRLWNLKGKQSKTFFGHSSPIRDVIFNANSQILASFGARDNEEQIVKFWSREGNEIGTLSNPLGDEIIGIHFSQDGKKFLAVDRDYKNLLTFWNLELADLLQSSCLWFNDYLNNNSNLQPEDRNLCPVNP